MADLIYTALIIGDFAVLTSYYGTDRVAADFRLLAAATNLARLGMLELRGTAHGWAVVT